MLNISSVSCDSASSNTCMFGQGKSGEFCSSGKWGRNCGHRCHHHIYAQEELPQGGNPFYTTTHRRPKQTNLTLAKAACLPSVGQTWVDSTCLVLTKLLGQVWAWTARSSLTGFHHPTPPSVSWEPVLRAPLDIGEGLWFSGQTLSLNAESPRFNAQHLHLRGAGYKWCEKNSSQSHGEPVSV